MDKECNITVTKYPLKFSHLGVGNSYIFNAFLNFPLKSSYEGYYYYLRNYDKLTQISFRINAKDYILWS